MPDDIDARLAAHRAAFSAVAMVMEEVAPGAFDNIIEALSTFETLSRQRNEHSAGISELRFLRESLIAMRGALPGPR